jgi:transposase
MTGREPAPGVGRDSLRVPTSTSMTSVLQTGCAWDALLDSFPISRATAHRRFSEWVDRGVMQALHQAVLAA